MSFFSYHYTMNDKWRKLRWKKKNREERKRKKGRKGGRDDLG